MNFYLLMAGLISVDLIAQISAKMWYLKGNNWYLVFTILLFALCGFLLGLSLKYEGVAITNVIWVALSSISITIAGFYFFKEPIAIHQFIGIAIIIFGLAIIQWK